MREENLFPRFTTIRKPIDGKHWFPTLTYADDTLEFRSGPLRERLTHRLQQLQALQRDVHIHREVEAGTGSPGCPIGGNCQAAKPNRAPNPPALAQPRARQKHRRVSLEIFARGLSGAPACHNHNLPQRDRHHPKPAYSSARMCRIASSREHLPKRPSPQSLICGAVGSSCERTVNVWSGRHFRLSCRANPGN